MSGNRKGDKESMEESMKAGCPGTVGVAGTGGVAGCGEVENTRLEP